jgi:thioredoxin reductase (NADPH)
MNSYKELYNKYKNKYFHMKKQIAGQTDNIYNVIIIGGGCAGLSAAIYCGRAELKPLLFAGDLEDKGGLLMKTSVVENFPSYPDGILGYDLIKNMEEHATIYGTEIRDKKVIGYEFDSSTKLFKVIDDDKKTYFTKSIIITTGSTPNKLKLENEDKLWGKGISSCAVCDGALYKNKKIIVVGGGDTALEMSNFLTKFSNVLLIHRRESFRASKIMQNKVLNNDKIKIIYDTIITKLHGTNKLTSVTCKNVKNEEEFDLEVDGLFYGLGLTPNSQLFKNQLKLDSDGYIVKNKESKYETATNMDGIFVAGDIADKIYRQAIVAAGDGCRAALDVINYLEEK